MHSMVCLLCAKDRSILMMMAIINKSTTSTGEDVEKRVLPFVLLLGIQVGAATVESSMEISQKIENGSDF